jgi:hypothetical protein
VELALDLVDVVVGLLGLPAHGGMRLLERPVRELKPESAMTVWMRS